jgi:tetratricopeptide (TPR) repeat protein
VGRQSQLDRLQNTLFAKDQPPRLAITGLGGVGKTQIVLELAYRIREKYPECSIFWMQATNTESLQQAYLDVGRQLGIPGLHEEQADVKKLVQRHLSQERTGQWLLIFDNADEMDMWIHKDGDKSDSHGLKDYLPRSRQGCVVLTTRSRKIAVKLAQSNVIEVLEMEEEVATQLLSKSLINQELSNNRPDTLKLLEQLTFLPLAIVQAAAYINENGITLSDYLSLLEEQEQDVVDLLSEDFEDEGRYQDVKNPVATTWLISFEYIRRLDPLAAEYMSFMSCVDPKDVPQSLLPAAQSRKKETDAIGTLDAYSFVIRRSADHALDVHRLVHLATRNWLRREESLTQWAAKAMRRLKEVFPDHDHKKRSVWRMYLAHARYVLESDDTKDEMQERTGLLWKFAMCLYSDGRYNETEKSFSQVLETFKRVLGEEHPSTLTSMANLALTIWNQGRWKEAEELEVEVMETFRRVLGEEHPDTLTSMDNLASMYRNQGRWKEAEELEVQVMETRKRVLGEEHPSMLTSMNNLAHTWKSQGCNNEAITLLAECYELRKRILGPHHPFTLSSLGALNEWKMEQTVLES